jgi:hypothetical protein
MSFWSIKKGIKRRQSDVLFSKIVRAERGYRCEKCGRQHEINSTNLGLSHWKFRAAESVRYDRRNVDVLCNIPCHQDFGEGKDGKKRYDAWKKERMGTKAFNLLSFHAEQRGHHDRFIEKELCKEFRKELLT